MAVLKLSKGFAVTTALWALASQAVVAQVTETSQPSGTASSSPSVSSGSQGLQPNNTIQAAPNLALNATTPSTITPEASFQVVKAVYAVQNASPESPDPDVVELDAIPVKPRFDLNNSASPSTDTAKAGVLSLSQAVESAVYSHPTIRQAIGLMGQAHENIDVAKAGYYPQIQGGVRSEYDNSANNRYNHKLVQKAVVSATQMLYDFGKVSTEVDQAQARRMAAQAQVLLSIDDVARESAYAFIEVQRYQALEKVAEEQVERVSAIVDLARERRAQGASTLSDETQALSREASAQAMLLDIQTQVVRWQQNLSYLSSISPIGQLDAKVPEVFEFACAADTPEWALLPKVLVAEAQKAEALAALENANAQALPTLSLEGTVSRALNATPQSGSRNEAVAMLNLSMPFYQGGATSAQKRAARSGLGAAEAAANSARLTASQNLIEARNRTSGYRHRIGLLSQRIGSIAQTRDLYRDQYLSLGTRSLLDLLNAEQEYHQALQENINNNHDMRRMQVDCLYNSGRMREAFALDQTAITSTSVAP